MMCGWTGESDLGFGSAQPFTNNRPWRVRQPLYYSSLFMLNWSQSVQFSLSIVSDSLRPP